MEIINKEPPHFKEIKMVFDLEGIKPVFTYGDKIYNPMNLKIPDHVIEHEKVHAEQQKHSTFWARLWWKKYLKNPQFRLNQELEAYKVQYQFAKKLIKDRNALARFLNQIAQDLSGKMYGNVISCGEAMNKIKE